MVMNKFFFAFLSLYLFEILTQIINPASSSVVKVLLTLLIWISFYQSIAFFISKYKYVKVNIPNFIFHFVLLLIGWNVINIFRSLLSGVGTITTLLGNTNTSLALLVPFSLFFGLNPINLKIINKIFFKIIELGILVGLISFLFFGIGFGESNPIFLAVYCTIFLITILSFQNARNKIFILFGSILLLYLSFMFEDRTMLIRILSLYMASGILYFYKKFNFKWILSGTFFALFIPFYLLVFSVSNGESAFEYYLSKSEKTDMITDTRTFLYIEVFKDLEENKSLIFGKGSNATYFSDYFKNNKGDSEIRLNVEVGILSLLLKGGMIAVILNLTMLFIAIYLAFFRSENLYVVGIGFMLLIHTILLFVENIPGYTTYNFLIWFFIGVCLSKKIRYYNTKQIKDLLRS